MKKTILKTFVMISLIGGFAITSTSCKKKGCTDESASNYDPDAQKDDGSCAEPGNASTPSNPQPQPQDADAVMIGLQAVTYTEYVGFLTEIPVGLPIALFKDGLSFKNVGEVTCEGESLEIQSNNSYIYIPSSTDLGVTFSGDIEWTVEGGNGFPAHTKSSSGIFPQNLALTVTNGDAIDISGAFTLETTSSITSADSVYFGVYGPSNAIISVQPGSVSSYTFTAAEMKSVGAGGGFVQVAAYRVAEIETLGTGEVIYYLNEKVNTTAVTFE